MEALKEKPQVEEQQTEIFGNSLWSMRRLGEISSRTVVDAQELMLTREQARADFESSIYEGLSTERDMAEKLEVTKFRHHEVVDGQVVSIDGKTPMVEILENAVVESEINAKKDQRRKPEATRSKNDHLNAEEVDKMVRGETDYNTRMVVTPYVEEAEERDGPEFWFDRGYVPSVRRAYVQLYHVTDEGKLLTGTISVDWSDKSKWRKLFADRGVNIPDNESTDNWLQYPIKVTMTEDEAISSALGIRSEYGQSTGQDTVGILEEQRDFVDEVFENSYKPVAMSLEAGEKNETTATLASQYLQMSSDFNDETRKGLMKIANKESFDDDDARLLKDLIIYSTIEFLRSKIVTDNSEYSFDNLEVYWQKNTSLQEQMEITQSLLANFAQAGAKKGRVYGSCGGSLLMALAESAESENGDLSSPQMAYGGRQRKCKELKDGDLTNCPLCKKKNVKVAIEDKKLKCDNPDCAEASSKAKSKKKIGKLSLVAA